MLIFLIIKYTVIESLSVAESPTVGTVHHSKLLLVADVQQHNEMALV